MSIVHIPTTTFWGFFVIFLAGATAGLTGFGFALVAVPLLMIFLPPKVAVPTVLILYNLGSILVIYETRKWIDLKRMWPLMAAGVAGTPLGAYLLLILDVNVLKVLIGTVIVLSAATFLAGFQWRIRNARLARVFSGLASGVLGGSTGMSGPPVVLFFSNQGTEKQTFRANLTLFFVVLNSATILFQGLGGLVTKEVLTYCLWFLPALLIGTPIGIKLAGRVSETVFRKAALIVVAITGLSAVASGVGLF